MALRAGVFIPAHRANKDPRPFSSPLSLTLFAKISDVPFFAVYLVPGSIFCIFQYPLMCERIKKEKIDCGAQRRRERVSEPSGRTAAVGGG
jgi:hypothetical protein